MCVHTCAHQFTLHSPHTLLCLDAFLVFSITFVSCSYFKMDLVFLLPFNRNQNKIKKIKKNPFFPQILSGRYSKPWLTARVILLRGNHSAALRTPPITLYWKPWFGSQWNPSPALISCLLVLRRREDKSTLLQGSLIFKKILVCLSWFSLVFRLPWIYQGREEKPLPLPGYYP